METTLKFHYAYPQTPFHNYRSQPPSLPSINHPRPNFHQQQHHHNHHHHHGGSQLSMSHSIFQRISPNRIINSLNNNNRSHHLPHFIIMSNQSKQQEDVLIDSSKSTLNVKQEEEEKKKTEAIPEPPEKPLPGDCCGSGCVRCVWDIYYEELEEYNNLVKSKSEAIDIPKAS